jgi:hypothetical protein
MRFTIRDVFWLILVLALCFGWWADYSMLRSLVYHFGQKWRKHVLKEHPGQMEYERLMSEWTGPPRDSN